MLVDRGVLAGAVAGNARDLGDLSHGGWLEFIWFIWLIDEWSNRVGIEPTVTK